MKKLLFTIAMSLFFIATVSAQGFSCASDIIEQSMITTYPGYANDRAQLESFTQRHMYSANARMLNFGCQPTVAIYDIPVVVHIVHLGESIGTGTNISDAQVQRGLDDANTFSIPYMGMRFVLAKTNPDGSATNGINRVNGSSVPNYPTLGIDPSTNPTGAPDTTVKNLSIWSWQNYVNIWVVNKSVTNGAYANMPSSYKFQGVVIPYNAFGTTNNTTTCCHELFHYFNLYHVFQGSSGTTCSLNDDPENQGDKNADTPPCLQTDCGSLSCGPFPNPQYSYLNIMSYCTGRNLFTPGQKTRATAALFSNFRWSLVTSPGLNPVDVATEVSVDSIGFEQNLNQPLCDGWLTTKVRIKNYGQTVNSMEILLSVNNMDTVFTVYPGLLRGTEGFISLIPVKFMTSGINNIEVIVRKVNGVTDYNQLNNNLCTDVTVIVQTITVSTSVNIAGAGTITGAGTFSCNGVNDSIRVTTNPGYVFQNIKEGNTVVSTVPLYVLPINLSQGNRTFTANFTVATYSINATTNPTNGGTVTGTGTYNYGSNVVITFKSKAGYYLVNVTENGNIISTDSVVSISALAANRTLVGNFALKTFNITTSANGVGGSVSGGGTVSYGTSTTVSASEFSCYQFSNWTENGNIVSTNKNYTFTVTGNRTLVANFTQKQFLVVTAVNNAALGTATGGDTYGCGSNVTVSAHVKPGGKWLNWTENGNIISTDSTINNLSVTSARNLVANFATMTYVISAGVNIAGAGTIIGAGTLAYNTSATLQVSESPCYTFLGWYENGILVFTGKTYTFTVTGNRNLVAMFAKKRYTITTVVNDSTKGFATGGGNYGCDTTTKLYAHVKPGGKWLNWTDDAGTIVSTDSILSITVLSSKTYHANFVQVVTGVINHSNTLDFRIFPNPTSSVLQIECGSMGTYQAEIFNMVGDLVWSEKITQRLTVDVINFAKGCYIVKIDDGEGSITSKQFIVQ